MGCGGHGDVGSAGATSALGKRASDTLGYGEEVGRRDVQDAIYALKRFRQVAVDEILDLDQLDGGVRVARDDILTLLQAADCRLDLVALLHGIVQDLRAQKAGLCACLRSRRQRRGGERVSARRSAHDGGDEDGLRHD